MEVLFTAEQARKTCGHKECYLKDVFEYIVSKIKSTSNNKGYCTIVTFLEIKSTYDVELSTRDIYTLAIRLLDLGYNVCVYNEFYNSQIKISWVEPNNEHTRIQVKNEINILGLCI